MKRLTLLLWLAMCGVCYGDIDVKETYEAGEPIVVKVVATGVPDGAKLRGAVVITDARFLQPSTDAVYYVWAGTGEHTVTATGVWVVTQDIKVGDSTVPVLVDFGQYSYSKKFTVGKGSGPNPPKPPTPGGPYQVVMFYDEQQLDDLPVAQRDLLTSMVAQGKIAQAGHVVQGVLSVQSIGSTTGPLAPFIKEVQGDPLPRIAVAPKSGGVVRDYPLPASLADLEALLSKELP